MHEVRVIQRQKRGEKKFDASMHEELVRKLLRVDPLHSFRKELHEKLDLGKLLLTESRLQYFNDGQCIYQFDDYGDSCYLVLSGKIRSFVRKGPSKRAAQKQVQKKTWKDAVRQLFDTHQLSERRNVSDYLSHRDVSARQDHVTLNSLEKDTSWAEYLQYTDGAMFGHIAASARTPRNETVIADGRVEVLELKWQVLRELKKHSELMQNSLERDFRNYGLYVFLNTLPELASLDSKTMELILEHSRTVTLGDADWNIRLRKLREAADDELNVDHHPVVKKGDYAEHVYIVRSGFVVMDDGQKKIYKTQGEIIGLDSDTLSQSNWPYSIDALLFSELICFPRYLLKDSALDVGSNNNIVVSDKKRSLDKLFGENLFVNGRKTMLINLDRCTECDDCVVACASAHGGNPRFIRKGPAEEQFMVASACMHCKDPVCLIGCPTGAIRRKSDGSVVINDQTCIGCTTCANSCPYDNIRMVNILDEKGRMIVDDQHQPIVKASKCDLCFDQLTGPACEYACPNDALKRVDIEVADKQVKKWIQ